MDSKTALPSSTPGSRLNKIDGTLDNAYLINRLRGAREFLQLSQTEVAARTSIRRSALSEIECGRRAITVAELKSLSFFYRLPVAYFIDEFNPEELAGATATRPFQAALADLNPNDQDYLLQFALFLKNGGSKRAK
jgi:transcriptional regulator with XRE-family HTH domain